MSIKNKKKKSYRFKLALPILSTVLKKSYDTEKKHIYLMIILIILNIVQPIPMIFFPKLIIDSLLIKNEILLGVLYSFALTISLMFTNNLLISFQTKFELSQIRQKDLFLTNLSKKIMEIDYQVFNNMDMKEKIIRSEAAITGNISWDIIRGIEGDKGLDAISTETINIISCLIKIIGLFYLINLLDFWINIVLVVIIFLNTLFSIYEKRADYVRRNRTSKVGNRAFYSREAILNPENAKEIRLLNLQKYLIKKYHAIKNELYEARYYKFDGVIISSIATILISSIQKLVVLLYLIKKIVGGVLSVGSFFMYFTAIETFSSSLIKLINSYLNLSLFSRYLQEYVDIMNMKADDNVDETITKIKSYDIEFKNVWFKYPNNSEYSLKNINLKIKQGETLSLVGHNGAGKSTLIKILLKLYKPEKGGVFIGGININKIDNTYYKSLVSSIFQDFTIFPFSVKDNICFGENEINRYNEVMKKTKLFDLVKMKNKGHDTIISNKFDKSGIELSQGENQKVALSRCLFKKSKIIILDEPTASMDAIAEKNIYENFSKMTNNCTAIFISHRMASSKICNNIAVLNKGVLIEYGSHVDLMNIKGKYYEMFTEQSKYYKE